MRHPSPIRRGRSNLGVCLIAAAFLAGSAWLGTAHADDPAPPLSAADHAGIETVIRMQIEAFRHDDAKAAFAAAAPNIQARFGTPERFLGIVQRLYQPVYRPREFAFREVVSDAGELIQKVEIVGPDGAHELARYAMARQADGSWRIAGCELTKSEELNT